jgi:hypothetical protein
VDASGADRSTPDGEFVGVPEAEHKQTGDGLDGAKNQHKRDK